MQALSIVSTEAESPVTGLQAEIKESPVQDVEQKEEQVQSSTQSDDTSPLSPKESSKEKIKEHYAAFARQFQENNINQCPMVGYNVHWIYSAPPAPQN